MEHHSCFLMANKRGVLGWTIMKFDGVCYWTPSNKWYSSYKVANRICEKLDELLKTKRL